MEFLLILIRLLQLFFLLVITALIGNVIAVNVDGPMAGVNFTMFVAVLSWIAALYGLAGAFLEVLAMPLVHLVLDGAAALFTLIDGIALAALIKPVNCADPGQGAGWIGYGTGDVEKRCREIQASTAFMWFLWAALCVGLVFHLRGGGGFSGSARSVRSGPAMSQVGRA